MGPTFKESLVGTALQREKRKKLVKWDDGNAFQRKSRCTAEGMSVARQCDGLEGLAWQPGPGGPNGAGEQTPTEPWGTALQGSAGLLGASGVAPRGSEPQQAVTVLRRVSECPTLGGADQRPESARSTRVWVTAGLLENPSAGPSASDWKERASYFLGADRNSTHLVNVLSPSAADAKASFWVLVQDPRGFY